MEIREVIDSIEKSKEKKDLLHELTPKNRKIMSRAKGTFEAVLSGRGKEKYLIPEAGTLHYLYRGQSQEFTPCVPTLYRGNLPEERIFVERMRLTVFKRLLESHPVVSHFFRKHDFVVDVEGMAQHYGLKTCVLDLTSNLDIAFFFATCPYDPQSDTYSCVTDEETHEGVLYVFDPLFDNEPIPLPDFSDYMRGNIRPIGLQAFRRPGAQEGYALHIPKGQSTKSWMFRFSYTAEDSKHYYEMFNGGESLWVKDELVDKVAIIKGQNEFSFDVFDETFEFYRPKGFSKTSLKKIIKKNLPEITLTTKYEDLVFSKMECRDIIARWNNGDGENFCKTIVRKPWYNHDGVNDNTKRFENIRNHHDFNTFDHMSEFMLLKMIASPDGPEGAEWVNYMNTPRPMNKLGSDKCRKIEACANTVFGKPWLTEADWRILP